MYLFSTMAYGDVLRYFRCQPVIKFPLKDSGVDDAH